MASKTSTCVLWSLKFSSRQYYYTILDGSALLGDHKNYINNHSCTAMAVYGFHNNPVHSGFPKCMCKYARTVMQYAYRFRLNNF